MSTTTTPATAARQELGASFAGELIGPDDAGYDEARTLYNAMIDKRPALVARPADSAGVARIVAFARAHGLALAVHGGGHNGPGFGSVDDGVVCDLSLLREITDDLHSRQPRAVDTVSIRSGNALSGRGVTNGARLMPSTPPTTSRSASPASSARAPWMTDSPPEAQRRFSVTPGTDTGRPASSAAMRATLRLSSPAPFASPSITSSMRARSRPG